MILLVKTKQCPIRLLESLKTFPDLAVEDKQPLADKIKALKILMKFFEEREDYEDCAFIRDLQKNIEDAEER
jgi:protein-arginine kinase activator protein McsA